MIYTADANGRITATITAHAVGYEDLLSASGVRFVRTEERVDPDQYWIAAGWEPGQFILVERRPPLASSEAVTIGLGQSWSLPMIPARTVVSIDGAPSEAEADGPLEIAPEAPGVYDVTIDHVAYLPSRFVLTVTP